MRHKWGHVDDPQAVGDRLRASRERAGLSQRTLSFPGCSAAYISRIESGERVPSLQLLRELGRRLGVSADYLAMGDDHAGLDPLFEAELALRFGDDETAERIFSEALNVPNATSRGRALGGLGQLDLRRGDAAAAVEKLEQANSLLGSRVAERPAIVEELGRAYAAQGDLDSAITLFERAADEATGDTLAESHFRLLLASALADAGGLGRAEEVLRGVVGALEDLRDPILAARLYRSQARAHAMRGEHEMSSRYARQALAAVELSDHTGLAARAHQLLASAELERGEAAPALELIEQGLSLARRAGERTAESFLRAEEARARLALGETGRAHELALAVADTVAATRRLETARALGTLADVLAATGDRPRALDLYEAAAESLQGRPSALQLDLHSRWAAVLEADDRPEEALAVLKRAVESRSPATNPTRGR